MSKRSSRTVSEIIEKYRNKYPQAERKILRRLILLEHKQTNARTLDRHLRKAFSAKKPTEEESSKHEKKSDFLKLSGKEGEIIKKLRDGPTYLHDNIKREILDESTASTIKGLEVKGMIYQKEGKYFLPGYKNGPPERGREAVIATEHLAIYQSWGWKFKSEFDHEMIVRYERPLGPKYV